MRPFTLILSAFVTACSMATADVSVPLIGAAEGNDVRWKLEAYERGTIDQEELIGRSEKEEKALVTYCLTHTNDVPVRAKLPLSRCLGRLNRMAEAARLAAEYVNAYPNDWEGWRLLGGAEMASHRLGEAIAAYTNAVRLGDERCCIPLAAASLAADRLEIVRDILPRLFILKGNSSGDRQRNLEAVLTLVAYAIKADRKDVFTNAVAGVTVEQILSRDDLADLVVSACQDFGVQELAYGLAAEYSARAKAEESTGSWQRAIRNWSQCVKLLPGAAAAYDNRANARRNAGDLEGAILDWSQAIALNPRDSWAYASRGVAYHAKRRFEEASKDLTHAISINSNNPVAYYNRGNTYLAVSNLDKAISDFGRAIVLDPENAPAWCGRGCAHMGKQEWSEAIADCAEAVRLQPENTTARLNRGRAYMAKGDCGKAIDDFGWVANRDLSPSLAREVHLDRGRARYSNAQYGDAIADYEKAIALDPNAPSAYCLLGWLLSSCPSASFRDGKRAVGVAKRACELTGWADWHSKACLAAAYAEIGDFTEALRWQKQALSAEGMSAEDRTAESDRLTLYEHQRPFHEDLK